MLLGFEVGVRVAEHRFVDITTMLCRSHPKFADKLTASGPDVLAFAEFARRRWLQLWSTNPLERMNKNIKHRTYVVGVFPNAAALLLSGWRSPD